MTPPTDSARPAAGEPSDVEVEAAVEAYASPWIDGSPGWESWEEVRRRWLTNTSTKFAPRWEVMRAALRAAAATRTDQAAEIERLKQEREQIALAICGGEDAPGYAGSLTVEDLETVIADSLSAKEWNDDQIAALDAAEARAREAVEVLREIEWGGRGILCPSCSRYRENCFGDMSPSITGHAPDCRLDAVLRALPIADRPDQSEGGDRG